VGKEHRKYTGVKVFDGKLRGLVLIDTILSIILNYIVRKWSVKAWNIFFWRGIESSS
jgi:type IV secretory pathway TrbD component